MDSQEDVKEMEANCTLELGPPSSSLELGPPSSSSFASAYSFQSSVKPEQHSQEESRMKIDLDLDMISLSWHQALHDQTSQFSPALSSNLTPAQDSESHLHQFHNNYSEHHDIQFQDYLSMDRDRYDISNRPQHQSQQQLGFGYSWVAEELKSREDAAKQGLGSLVWFRTTSPSDNDLQKNFDMSYSSPKNMARVCVDCKTTKTPLWRSGPQGPKSLCNACGIRYRKARRALAAAALGNPTDISPSKPASFKRKPHDNTSEKKKKKLNNNVASSSSNSWKKKAHSHTASASTSTAPFNRVFARDEEEAAVLLMALSCGLVHV